MEFLRFSYTIIVVSALFLSTSVNCYAQDIPVPEDNIPGSDVVVPEEEETSPEEEMEPDSVLPGSHVEEADTMGSEAFTPNVSFNSLLSQNMRDMKSLPLTGQMDEDYAQLMAEHHEGAIRMAELYLVSGTDDQLKQMAENMINRKATEYEKLLNFVDPYSPQNSDSVSTSTLLDPMKRMMDRQQGRQATENMEKDFVSMMIDHHTSGIEMSELEIYTGSNKELKELAKAIKEGDQKELNQLKQWHGQTDK